LTILSIEAADTLSAATCDFNALEPVAHDLLLTERAGTGCHVRGSVLEVEGLMFKLLATAAGIALLVAGGQAHALAISLSSATTNLGDPLLYDLPSAVFTANGLPTGKLSASGSNPDTATSIAVSRSQGLGVRSCSGFLSCLAESDQLDGLRGADTATFSITGQLANFKFTLVSATFNFVDDVIGLAVLDDLRLSFGGDSYDIDIAGVAAAQGTDTCNLLAGDRICTVDFVALLGGGDPYQVQAGAFGFTAPSLADAWYIREIVVDIARMPVTEPGTLMVLGLGLLGLRALRRKT
jgi:hypothetical protein